MFLGKRKRPNTVGVDISNTNIKLVELKRSGSVISLEHYAILSMPHDAFNENGEMDSDMVSVHLARALKQAGISNKNAAIAISGSSIITKKITIPSGMDEYETLDYIESEAEQYVHRPLDETHIDFQLLGQSAEPESVDVLLAAAESDEIERRIMAVEGAHMEAKIIDVEAYALRNSLYLIEDQLSEIGVSLEDDSEDVVIVADIGDNAIKLTVIEKGGITYSREQSQGCKRLTNEIISRYDLSLKEAQVAKKFGGLPDDYYASVLPQFVEAIINQLGRLINMYTANSNDAKPSAIVLTGGGSKMAGLQEGLEASLPYSVVVADPFKCVDVKQKLTGNVDKDGPSLMIACGLALRSFEL